MNNSFQFVEIDLIPAVGLSTTLTTSQHENFVIISSLWKRFNAEFHKIGNRPPSGKDWEKYGITYSQNHEYCYLAAIRYMDNMQAPVVIAKGARLVAQRIRELAARLENTPLARLL